MERQEGYVLLQKLPKQKIKILKTSAVSNQTSEVSNQTTVVSNQTSVIRKKDIAQCIPHSLDVNATNFINQCKIAVSKFQGGELSKHLQNWKKLTSDQNILNIISGDSISLY